VSRGYLLDTSVISRLAPDRASVDPKLSVWLRDRQERLYLSAITVAEIEMGVRKLQRAGASARAAQLSAWLDRLTQGFGERVLAVDATVARAAGALSKAAVATGRHPGYADVLIAATARVHDLLLLTANARHFDAIGVANADPSREAPD
jgi:predicted nucleic acid-binding protein